MSKEVQMTFRVAPELRAAFADAALSEDRPASQVLRELMRAFVMKARERSRPALEQVGSGKKWTQSEAVAFECAREVITDVHAILTSQIAEESGKVHPDSAKLLSLRAERSRLFQERAGLHVHDHVEIARIRAQYGEMVRSWRAEGKFKAA